MVKLQCEMVKGKGPLHKLHRKQFGTRRNSRGHGQAPLDYILGGITFTVLGILLLDVPELAVTLWLLADVVGFFKLIT